jgi:hypothetical protein
MVDLSGRRIYQKLIKLLGRLEDPVRKKTGVKGDEEGKILESCYRTSLGQELTVQDLERLP